MADQKTQTQPRRHLYEEHVVTDLRGALEKAKVERQKRLSRREIIDQLKDELQGMLRSGWTYDDLVELLAKKDFPVSVPMLRELLRAPKKRRTTTHTSSK
jgi:uncharacterized protein YehS (DUF1456 family)